MERFWNYASFFKIRRFVLIAITCVKKPFRPFLEHKFQKIPSRSMLAHTLPEFHVFFFHFIFIFILLPRGIKFWKTLKSVNKQKSYLHEISRGELSCALQYIQYNLSVPNTIYHHWKYTGILWIFNPLVLGWVLSRLRSTCGPTRHFGVTVFTKTSGGNATPWEN